MRAGSTDLYFLLDASASMKGNEEWVIGGFNEMISRQKLLPGGAMVSLAFFGDDSREVYAFCDIESVPELGTKEYVPRGSTALLDAAGKMLEEAEKHYAALSEEELPEHVMFVIITDGVENNSQYYTAEEVRAMIRKKRDAGWDFVYVGADLESVENAVSFGIDRKNVGTAVFDAPGIGAMFRELSGYIEDCRKSDTCMNTRTCGRNSSKRAAGE